MSRTNVPRKQHVSKHTGRDWTSSEEEEADESTLRTGQLRTMDEWTEFHQHAQQKLGLYGSCHSIIWHVMGQKHPTIREDIVQAEMATATIEPDQATVVETVEDGVTKKRIVPIRVKTEPDRQYYSVSPGPPDPVDPPYYDLTIAETLPRTEDDPPFQPKEEEYTTDEDLISDSAPLPIESDSSDAELFEEKPIKVEASAIEESLLQISAGLRAAADGYDQLRLQVHNMAPYEAAQIAAQIPPPPGPTVPAPILRTLKTEGEDETVTALARGLHAREGASYSTVEDITGLSKYKVISLVTGRKPRGGGRKQVTSTGSQPKRRSSKDSRSSAKSSASSSRRSSKSDHDDDHSNAPGFS